MQNVRDFGAKGDGVTKDTAAIQRAIDAGGQVFFPPGVYLTGTIYLKSHGGLVLDSGARLLASPDLGDYNPPDFAVQNRIVEAEMTKGGHLICCVEAEEVSITGLGTIDGNCFRFMNEVGDDKSGRFKLRERPAEMLFFAECSHVRINDLNLVNSPYLNTFFFGCRDIFIRGVHIDSSPRVLNDDGLLFDSCRRVTVSDCIIRTGDDCISLRANRALLKCPRPSEDVVVSNSLLHSYYANAIQIGPGNGEIHRARFENLVITGYRTAVSIIANWLESGKLDNCHIHDIVFRDISTSARRPFDIMLDNRPGIGRKAAGRIYNILFSSWTGTMEISGRIVGNDFGAISDVFFENFRLDCGGVGPAKENDVYGNPGHGSTDAAIEIHKAERIEFRRMVLRYVSGAWKRDIRAVNAGVTAVDCPFTLGTDGHQR